MRIFSGIFWLLCISTAALVLFFWTRPSEIKLYGADELVGLTCAELGERHEEVIFAYHDAAIDYYNREGAFPEDLGLPKEEVLPIVVLMKKFVEDNGLRKLNLSEPFLSTSNPQSSFFAEISAVCATNPSLDALDAMRQAAEQLNLIDAPTHP